MDVLLDIGALFFGGLVLYLGAEWLVKGSAGLAREFGVKPLVIGLTVVAYGTSAPELAVSAAAVVDGEEAIAIGNVLGSCIANLGLILGMTALIAPPSVDGTLIRREIPWLLLSVLAFPLVLIDNVLVMWEAIILLGGAIAFTLFALTISSSGNTPSTEILEESAEVGGAPKGEGRVRLGVITFIGLALLIGGGKIFVDGAAGLAYSFGMSRQLVGSTIVAIGTSLPELAASIVAATRGHSSLAIGNVIGSNIFNIFLILGIVGHIDDIPSQLSNLYVDMGFFLGVTILAVFFMRKARKINRYEGILLIATYTTFVVVATIRGIT